MCYRYFMEESPELRPFVEAARHSALGRRMVSQLGRPLVTSGEVRPTDIAVVSAPNQHGQRTVFPMVWGFSGRSTLLFNARVETAGQKPTFRESWERRRCIVPASCYYEWEHFQSPDGKKKTGDRYTIQPQGETITLLAGLYRMEEKDGMLIPHFTILTREAAEEILFIHDRMPVILNARDAAAWIDPKTDPATVRTIAGRARTDMIFTK